MYFGAEDSARRNNECSVPTATSVYKRVNYYRKYESHRTLVNNASWI